MPTPEEERQRAFLDSLTREERVLLHVRDHLYGGSWAELLLDLQARLGRKPFVFKLSSRIEDDMERIARLRDYEEREGVDLALLLERAAGDGEDSRA